MVGRVVRDGQSSATSCFLLLQFDNAWAEGSTVASSLEDRVSRNAATKARQKDKESVSCWTMSLFMSSQSHCRIPRCCYDDDRGVAKRLTFPASSNSQILENTFYRLNQFSRLIATLTIELFVEPFVIRIPLVETFGKF